MIWVKKSPGSPRSSLLRFGLLLAAGLAHVCAVIADNFIGPGTGRT